MTEEQFTDEQGNIVTKKVGAESPPKRQVKESQEVGKLPSCLLTGEVIAIQRDVHLLAAIFF